MAHVVVNYVTKSSKTPHDAAKQPVMLRMACNIRILPLLSGKRDVMHLSVIGKAEFLQ